MKNGISFYAFLGISVLLLSCNKKSDNNPSNEKEVVQFFHEAGVPVQEFTFAASANINQATANGNYFVVSANSFVFEDNTAVVGNITIQLRECTSKSNMILSNITTLADVGMLTTSGILFINAMQNNKQLVLATGKSINYFLKTTFGNAAAVSKFNNASLPIDNAAVDASWVSATDTTSLSIVPDNNGGTSYLFSLNDLGWKNAAYVNHRNSSRKKITVETGSDFESTSSAVFVSIHGENTILKATSMALGIWELNNMPAGSTVSILSVGKKGGDYYFDEMQATLTDDVSVTLTPHKKSLAEIKLLLSQLP